MQKTNISYADFTWNPGCGCPGPVSAGCDNCWATDLHNKRHKAYKAGKKLPKQYARPFNVLQQFDDKLTDPLHRRIPSVIAVQFMGDLFAQPFKFIDKVFAVMALCPQHTFLVLTKREKEMAEYITAFRRVIKIAGAASVGARVTIDLSKFWKAASWPLKNVWLGVTAENQEQADKRIPLLLQTPAAKRFVSIEPMLEDIDIQSAVVKNRPRSFWYPDYLKERLHMIICSGESGPGARPMHPDWARSLRVQCESADVPFYFKQWGEWLPEHQTEWSHCTMTERKTKDNEPIYELFDCNDNVIATGITEYIGANKGAWIRCGKKKAGHLLDGVEHKPEF